MKKGALLVILCLYTFTFFPFATFAEDFNAERALSGTKTFEEFTPVKIIGTRVNDGLVLRQTFGVGTLCTLGGQKVVITAAHILDTPKRHALFLEAVDLYTGKKLNIRKLFVPMLTEMQKDIVPDVAIFEVVDHAETSTLEWSGEKGHKEPKGKSVDIKGVGTSVNGPTMFVTSVLSGATVPIIGFVEYTSGKISFIIEYNALDGESGTGFVNNTDKAIFVLSGRFYLALKNGGGIPQELRGKKLALISHPMK